MSVPIRRALVTGAAGFIGSTLVDRLLDLGVDVVGVDGFTPYYPVSRKRANLQSAMQHPQFTLKAADLCTDSLEPLLDGVDVVFHQAAQPGVRSSWADGFASSVTNNVLATQRLLEAARDADLRRFVYASSSSVYGDARELPMREDGPLRPFSPYGVTKLSAEQLCTVYAQNWDVPTVSLRYFTVYGPRQRPDMATYRLIESALRGHEFPLFGTGNAIRDFTFVEDVVDANLAAAARDLEPATIINVAGGSKTTMLELINLIEGKADRPIRLARQPSQAGDVAVTEAELVRVRELLDWKARTDLAEGIAKQVAWHAELSEASTND